MFFFKTAKEKKRDKPLQQGGTDSFAVKNQRQTTVNSLCSFNELLIGVLQATDDSQSSRSFDTGSNSDSSSCSSGD